MTRAGVGPPSPRGSSRRAAGEPVTRALVGPSSPSGAARPWPALGVAVAALGLSLAPAQAAAQAQATPLPQAAPQAHAAPPSAAAAQAPATAEFVPVTDAMLQDPAPEDWLTWRRTLDAWGYSPLDQIDRSNVGDLRMVWTRALTPGSQQGTPLVYRGVLYMPNPGDVIQAIDAATGDLV